MPTRRDIFVNGGIYHIFSKSIDKKLVFKNKELCIEFLNTANYYKSSTTIRFSKYKELLNDKRIEFEKNIIKPRVQILSYCLMPNHYHFLIKQKKDKGIIRFMADILNSFTRYYNSKNKRKGSVFLTPFRSRKIVSDEQFIHTSRYIHLNPYSAGLVNTHQELIKYPYSSFKEFIYPNRSQLCNTEPILKMFGDDREKYREFALSNAEHQRTLEYLKYTKDYL